MTKNKFAAALLGMLFLASTVRADSYMEFKGLMMEKPAKTWTSGLKQRHEMQAPMIGQMITITRVDKGVVWTLNPRKKTYSEKPIALPYRPAPKTKNDRTPSKRDDTRDEKKCTPDVTKLSNTRVIAGMKSTGYKMACKESPKEGMTTWIGETSSAAEAAMKEQQKFGTAHMKALYANYPAKERTDMEHGATFLSGLIQNTPKMMSAGKLPSGFWTAMEAESEDGEKNTVYELVKISADPAQASLFDVPAGYKKVKDGANAFGMSDMMSDEDKQEMNSEAKKDAAEAARGAAFKSILKGLGNR